MDKICMPHELPFESVSLLPIEMQRNEKKLQLLENRKRGLIMAINNLLKENDEMDKELEQFSKTAQFYKEKIKETIEQMDAISWKKTKAKLICAHDKEIIDKYYQTILTLQTKEVPSGPDLNREAYLKQELTEMENQIISNFQEITGLQSLI